MIALSSPADILIGGGAAGVGKTFSLLLEPLRHIHRKGFGGVIFRRTSPQIRAEGGLWDASNKLYGLINNSIPRETFLEWKFGNTSKLKFSHLQYEKDKFDWQGSEIAFMGFDELTHFTKSTFFYMLSRNRSTCGIQPYVRATCNPDPDSWVADLISWWIGEDGYPIPERQGVLRYFMQGNDNYIWGDTKEEVIEKGWHLIEDLVNKSGIPADKFVKSLTFVGGSIFDNRALLDVDPGYLANLNAQDEETKSQLLAGNWKVKISDKDIYDYNDFKNIFTNEALLDESARKYITADIALKGSDKMVVLVWHGFTVIDIHISSKNNGKEAVDFINSMKHKHKVGNANIIFDNDGVGGGISGQIEGAKEFHNGARPLKSSRGKSIDNYANLKTQCFYLSGDNISECYILKSVADQMYSSKETVRQRFMNERKAIKRSHEDDDGKLRIIPKKEMKVYLNGESPDLMDAFMMRQYFTLAKKFFVV